MNLNKFNLIEMELFIKMLYGVWSSLEPDHETNKSPRWIQVSPTATGNPGSVIVPKYGSSKITVYVLGKNTILKFVGNTKYKSMKLTLQLVVVVLIAPTKFRDNLFKFTLYTIIIYKAGDTRCHLRRHALIQHTFFHEIRTPTKNKHVRIVVIG